MAKISDLPVGTIPDANSLMVVVQANTTKQVKIEQLRPAILIPATSSNRGAVKISSGLNVTSDGTLTVVKSTNSLLGGVITGQTLDVDASGVLNYNLPEASETILGGIKVGDSLTIDDGILDYNIPAATSEIRGGITVGPTLTVDQGLLNYSLPVANTATLGGVRVGTSLTVAQNGTLNYFLPTATFTRLGGVRIGQGFNIDDGTISIDRLIQTHVLGDLSGSVFADDSTLLVDGQTGVVVAPIQYSGSGIVESTPGTLQITGTVNFNGVTVFKSFTEDDRNLLPSPAAGSVLFNSTTSKLQVFTGQVWDNLH
jgi:hypothetical protein